jgi:hypothetical protein
MVATKQRDGQITQNLSSPFAKKYFAFPIGQISGFSPRVSPTEGRLAIVTNARWDAVDAKAATDERGRCGRRSRVVLAPRCWRQVVWNVCAATVATKPVTGESTKETVKPLRREGRMLSAEPVCSCAHSFVHIAHETAGAARTRSSLRPLRFTRAMLSQTSGAFRREKRGVTSAL